MTKLLLDPREQAHPGSRYRWRQRWRMIGETVLALEMGADMEDIGLTIHPHPTLNETIGMAAEMAEAPLPT